MIVDQDVDVENQCKNATKPVDDVPYVDAVFYFSSLTEHLIDLSVEAIETRGDAQYDK